MPRGKNIEFYKKFSEKHLDNERRLCYNDPKRLGDFTMIQDYAKFDRVVAPVIIASPELRMIYANPYAVRVFPFLSAPAALISRFESADLEQGIRMLKQGEICILPYEESLHLSILLEPVLLDGELIYVCVYVVSDSEDPNTIFPFLADGELLKFLRDEVANPTNIILSQLKIMESIILRGDTERSLAALKMIRTRMLRMSLFYARMEDCSGKHSNNCEVFDAAHVLLEFEHNHKFIKYKPSQTCYVPLERSSQVLLYTDVLTSLIFRQDKPSVTITSSCDSNGVTIEFISGPLNKPIDVPCDDEYDGIDLGMFSVRRRAELAGGNVSVKKEARGGVTVTLKFPPVHWLLSNYYLSDPEGEKSTPVECHAHEYLMLMTEGNC